MAEGFCTLCGHEIEEFTDDMECCPNCKTISLPCSYDKQVNISINWHELRILCMWAEKWGLYQGNGAGVVYSIADRLLKQFDKDMPSLTLADEITELKKIFGNNNVKTNLPGIE